MIRITIDIISNYFLGPRINTHLQFKICSKIIIKIGYVASSWQLQPMVVGSPWNHPRNKKDGKSDKSLLFLGTARSGFQD
jgi:hypothetical protein